jgi:hypothetical protein
MTSPPVARHLFRGVARHRLVALALEQATELALLALPGPKTRRFGPLSAVRAHAKALYKPNLL